MPHSHRVSRSYLQSLLGRITLTSEPHEEAPLHSPFDNEVICQIPQGGKEDVALAVERARKVQPRWANTPLSVRTDLMRRVHDLVFEQRELLLDLLQLETGKARRHAFEEAADCMLVTRYAGYHSEKTLRPECRRGIIPLLTRTTVHHHPLGVVGLIVPWNYPLTLAMSDAIPALVAGNAVVVKPASLTPLTALAVSALFEKAGLPPGLFSVVTGSGRAVGEPLIDLVDFVQFTGSTETGKSVAKRAGERLIPASMELGGKNPMLVLPGANLKKVVEGVVRGCFSNAGQLCISVERIYVHQSMEKPLLDKLKQRLAKLRLGSGYDPSIEMGSLIDRSQLETVQDHIQDASEKGAKIVSGGRTRPDLGPWFHEPTVLKEVTPEMRVYGEETFGPVVSIYPYRDLEEAIELANDSPYGLNASIYCKNRKEGARIATRLQFGTVNINEVYAPTWGSTAAPMGGMKASGLGRRHGPEGLLKYTESQTISTQYLFPLSAPTWLSHHRYESILFVALKLLKKIPGIR